MVYIEDMKDKDPLAVALGKRGGLATKKAHSPEYFKELRAKRKKYPKLK